MRRQAARGFLFIWLLTLAACAPHIESAGPTVRDAAMTTDAFIMADDSRLPYRLWRAVPDEPPKAVILALHGFNDYSKSYEEAAGYWADRGIWTYAYDQRGFGETAARGLWPGGKALRNDLRAAARLLRQKHPGIPLVLVGESMGAAVILTATTHGAPPTSDRVVLSAPAVWGRQELPWLQEGFAWLAVHTIPWVKMQPRTKLKPSDNIEMLRALGRDPLVIKETRLDSAWGLLNLMTEAQQAAPLLNSPALILFGKKEELIPEEARERFLGNLPDGPGRSWHLIEYDDGYHMLMRDLKAKRVWADIARYALTGKVGQPDLKAEKPDKVSAREPSPDTEQ